MKRLLLSLFLISFSYSIQAQNIPDDLDIGIRAGFTSSSVGSFEHGLNIGVVAQKILDNRSMLVAELYYDQKYSGLNDNGEHIISKLGYLQLPVMGRYYLLKNFSFGAGPQFGFLIHHTDEIDPPGDVPNEPAEVDILKTFYFSGNLNFNYNFTRRFLIQARISFGFSHYYSDRGEDSIDNGVIADTLGLSVHYLF